MQDQQKTIQESIALEQAQRYSDAIQLIVDARRKTPGSRLLAIRHAELMEVIKQPANALQLYTQLAEAQPDNQEPLLVLGTARALAATKQYKKACGIMKLVRMSVKATDIEY